jgi:hypothetical protein
MFAAGCTVDDENTADRSTPAGMQLIELDLDRKDPRPFIEFYFSPYSSSDQSVLENGLVVQDAEDRFMLDLDRLKANYAPAAQLDEAAADGTLEWDELKPFLNNHYYSAIDAPATLADLIDPAVEESGGWMEIEVDGVMAAATRHILIPTEAVRSSLDQYLENDRALLFPMGTVIIADHVIDNATIETTAMRKRPDGQWDFFAYDQSGRLADSTTSPPKVLRIPTQCAGCHLGRRLYEPEKSFPGVAPPGPAGPRTVHVPPRLRNVDVTRFLDEHRKRSDGILGLYGTIFVSELLAQRTEGTITPQDATLLDKLGL